MIVSLVLQKAKCNLYPFRKFPTILVNYKLKDENGVEHEVTPFINSLYNSKSTFSFDNFFHQVGQGKTSDAETLLENSLFGLDQGSLFTQVGGKIRLKQHPIF